MSNSEQTSCRLIADKTIADVTEAILGFAYIHVSEQMALRFIQWLGLELDLVETEDGVLSFPPVRSPLQASLSANQEQLLIELCDGLEKVEAILDYRFHCKAHLLQAVTHASCIENRLTECYQK